jgi:hypothetical protein
MVANNDVYKGLPLYLPVADSRDGKKWLEPIAKKESLSNYPCLSSAGGQCSLSQDCEGSHGGYRRLTHNRFLSGRECVDLVYRGTYTAPSAPMYCCASVTSRTASHRYSSKSQMAQRLVLSLDPASLFCSNAVLLSRSAPSGEMDEVYRCRMATPMSTARRSLLLAA